MNTVLLLEDDPRQAEAIKNAVERNYPFKVTVVETESDFRAYIMEAPTFKTEPPIMVISDAMLPWVYPGQEASGEVPPEVQSGTFRKAGNRCWRLFREYASLTVPWIYFTVLDEETMGFADHCDEFTGYAQKAGSIEPLFREMARLFENSPAERKRLVEGLNTPLGDCTATLS